MRRKLIVLLFALTATAAGLGLFSPKPSEAAHCNGVVVCCPDIGCFCCAKPCFFVCN